MLTNQNLEKAIAYNLPSSSNGLPLSLRYDVIMRDDEVLEIPPKEITHITIYNGSYLLRYDIANGTGQFDDWREYADLLLLVALSNHNLGERANAVGNFTLATKMWDGTGLRDKAYDLPYGEGQAPLFSLAISLLTTAITLLCGSSIRNLRT